MRKTNVFREPRLTSTGEKRLELFDFDDEMLHISDNSMWRNQHFMIKSLTCKPCCGKTSVHVSNQQCADVVR